MAAILAPLALVAGLLLYINASSESSALPAYQLEDTPSPLVLAPGRQLELIARPGKAITGPVGARSYFVQGETVRPWVPTIDISKDGAVRVTAGPAGWSNLAPGRWDIVLLIARSDDLPTDATQARRVIASPEGKRIHVLRRAAEVTRNEPER